MRLHTRVCLAILLGACLGQTAPAQCPHTSQESGLSGTATPAALQRELEDRTVLLMLTLSKRGVVRDATVIKGLTTLREAAIEAAKKHNYKHQMNVWPFQGQISVEVIFPQDNRSSPEIGQVLPAGIPSCVSVSAIRIKPEIMQSRLLKRVEPVFPTEAQPVGGTIILHLRVDKDGSVIKAEKVSGPDTFAAPVIEAVMGWKYEPTLLNVRR
jgi:hypothetical protein